MPSDHQTHGTITINIVFCNRDIRIEILRESEYR